MSDAGSPSANRCVVNDSLDFSASLIVCSGQPRDPCQQLFVALSIQLISDMSWKHKRHD